VPPSADCCAGKVKGSLRWPCGFFVNFTNAEVVMVFAVHGAHELDERINVRLTRAEKERLKEDADLAGLSMSELVRRRYFGRPIIANADAAMIKELRRIGGLVKHTFLESNGMYSTDTSAALKAVKQYIEQLSRHEQPEEQPE
jgi:hypothetical protein